MCRLAAHVLLPPGYPAHPAAAIPRLSHPLCTPVLSAQLRGSVPEMLPPLTLNVQPLLAARPGFSSRLGPAAAAGRGFQATQASAAINRRGVAGAPSRPIRLAFRTCRTPVAEG